VSHLILDLLHHSNQFSIARCFAQLHAMAAELKHVQ